PSSLTMRSIFLPATVAPFLSMYALMPAWTCLPTGASTPVSGSTTPTFTSSAEAPVETSAPAANATPMIRSMRFPLRRVGLRQSISEPAAGHRTKDELSLIMRQSAQLVGALGVRLARRIDDLLELAEHAHAGKQLR